MAKDEFKISVRNIVEWLVRIGIVALFVFLWNINKKVNTISDNKASIGKLWQVYGKMDTRIDGMDHQIGTLKGRHTQ